MPGITELKEMVGFAIAIANAAGKVMEDSKLSLADLRFALDPLKRIAPALDGMDQIPSEIKDLTADEKDELIQFVIDEFEIPQDGIESAIESGLQMVSKIYDILVALGYIK
jgi:hypothetical protein